MADKSIGRSQCGDNYKVTRIWMTYYKVSHIYWNARPLSSGDKSSKKCRLKNGRPLPTMRWSPQTIGCWWGRVSSCAGPDHPHAYTRSLHFVWQKYKLCLSIDILLHGLCVPVRKITNYFQWHALSRFDKLLIQYSFCQFCQNFLFDCFVQKNNSQFSFSISNCRQNCFIFFQIYWSVSNKQ